MATSEFASITSPTKPTLLTVVDPDQAGRELYTSQAGQFNHELAANVQDSRLALNALQEELLGIGQEWRSRWGSWCENNLTTVQKFDAQYMHPSAIGFTTRTLDAELSLQLSTEWIQNYAANISAKVPSTAETFDDFYRGMQHMGKRNDALAFLTPVVKALFPLDDFGLVATAADLHDLQHADPFALIKAEYASSFAVLARLEAQTARAVEEREACIRSEDVKGAEQRAIKAVDTIVVALDTAYQRHRNAMATTAEIQQFQENVAATVGLATDKHLRASEQSLDFQQKTTQDHTKITNFFDAKMQDDAAAAAKFDAHATQFRDAMANSTRKQMATWDRIIADIRSLRAQSDERDELIADHQQLMTEECRRRQLQREVAAACDTRTKQLALIAANVANCLEMLALDKSYVAKADDYITRHNAMGKLEKLQLEEAIRCYNLYKTYTVHANTILFRRDQRLENMRRLLRTTQFQLNTAMETLDTDLPLYRDQVRALGQAEEQLAEQVKSFHQQIDEQQQLWLPIQEFLELRQKYVDPPSLIAQELQRDLMQEHVNAVDALTNNEQKLLDNEKAVVRKILNAVEAAKDTYKEKMERSTNGA